MSNLAVSDSPVIDSSPGSRLVYGPVDGCKVLMAGEELILELFLSDANYFRTCARMERSMGCEIVQMRGLESLAAGCLVQGLEHRSCDSHATLVALENRLQELGCTRARFYQQFPDPGLEAQFSLLGYRRVEEIALLNTSFDGAALTREEGEVTLVAVNSEVDWSKKLLLHDAVKEDPDGHASAAKDWVEMERYKSDAGYMQPYLIYCQGEVSGAVNLSLSQNLGRLKNLVIHPDWRRRGVGVKAARLIAGLARHHGKSAAGCFAIDNEPSLNLYKSAGYVPVSRQIEWLKVFS
jgi:ribosomal protein S18 acetylase RimI-like enzyme